MIVNKFKDLATDTPHDVTIQPKEPKGAPPVVLTGAFTLKKPEIDPLKHRHWSPEDSDHHKRYVVWHQEGEGIRGRPEMQGHILDHGSDNRGKYDHICRT